ncbi:uncharacterized protein LOC144129281 [Amblyomma americanum]
MDSEHGVEEEKPGPVLFDPKRLFHYSEEEWSRIWWRSQLDGVYSHATTTKHVSTDMKSDGLAPASPSAVKRTLRPIPEPGPSTSTEAPKAVVELPDQRWSNSCAQVTHLQGVKDASNMDSEYGAAEEKPGPVLFDPKRLFHYSEKEWSLIWWRSQLDGIGSQATTTKHVSTDMKSDGLAPASPSEAKRTLRPIPEPGPTTSTEAPKAAVGFPEQSRANACAEQALLQGFKRSCHMDSEHHTGQEQLDWQSPGVDIFMKVTDAPATLTREQIWSVLRTVWYSVAKYPSMTRLAAAYFARILKKEHPGIFLDFLLGACYSRFNLTLPTIATVYYTGDHWITLLHFLGELVVAMPQDDMRRDLQELRTVLAIQFCACCYELLASPVAYYTSYAQRILEVVVRAGKDIEELAPHSMQALAAHATARAAEMKSLNLEELCE